MAASDNDHSMGSEPTSPDRPGIRPVADDDLSVGEEATERAETKGKRYRAGNVLLGL